MSERVYKPAMEKGLDVSKMLEIASSTAKRAGDRLTLIGARSVNNDDGHDVKLQEDVDSEVFIREILEHTGIPVFGEEKGGDCSLVEKGGLYWIVDPIDGTYNYLRGMPGVCVSVALMRGWNPIVGSVYDFTRGELFCGGEGLPLTLNGREIKPKWEKRREQATIVTGFPSEMIYSEDNMRKFFEDVRKFKKVRMYGSAALAMAYVACGRCDCYTESRIKLWDIAGGLALVKSAGGICRVKPVKLDGIALGVDIDAAACEEFLVRK